MNRPDCKYDKQLFEYAKDEKVKDLGAHERDDQVLPPFNREQATKRKVKPGSKHQQVHQFKIGNREQVCYGRSDRVIENGS